MEHFEENEIKSILVGRKRLEWIAFNYELSSHAKERIKERSNTRKTIKEAIRVSPLSWICGKDTICIALNLYEYIIVSVADPVPVVVTFVNTSDKKNTVVDLAFNSYIKFLRGTLLEGGDR